MRLNRNTLGILLFCVVVMIGAVLLDSLSPADDTPNPVTPTVEPSLFFADLNINTLTQLEILEPATGTTTVLTRTGAEDAPVWTISNATASTDRPTDSLQAENAVVIFSALTLTDQFESDTLASFGLDAPHYTLTATDADGKTHRIAIGIKNPTAPRYYVLRNDETATVYQVPNDQLDALINLLQNPPYMPPPTSTPMPSSTPNPYSEVQQTQTAEAEATAFSLTEAAAAFSAEMLQLTPTAQP